MLLYHQPSATGNVYITRQHVHISIKAGYEALGSHMCECLLFAHAVSGCDTTSAIFGIGKVKHMKSLQASSELRSSVEIFGLQTASKEQVLSVGEKYVASLYKGGTLNRSLDELRHITAVSPKYVPPERMPPTKSACCYHSLRVHLQVSTWKELKIVLDPTNYGFQMDGTTMKPVISDKEAAPPELLKDLRCSCRSNICRTCSCAKMRIPCNMYCKCEGQCEESELARLDNDDDPGMDNLSDNDDDN